MKSYQIPVLLLTLFSFPLALQQSLAQISVQTTEVVHFPDFYLENAVREHFDKPTGVLTKTDLENMTSFSASGRGITNLTGLEYAVNLETLVLHNNNIKDLTPLKGLKSLVTLRMNRNKISDVSPLKELFNLESLTMMQNQIEDISSLDSLHNLVQATFHFNQISDIKVAKNWKKLKYFNMGFNRLNDLSALKDLIHLEGIWIPITKLKI